MTCSTGPYEEFAAIPNHSWSPAETRSKFMKLVSCIKLGWEEELPASSGRPLAQQAVKLEFSEAQHRDATYLYIFGQCNISRGAVECCA